MNNIFYFYSIIFIAQTLYHLFRKKKDGSIKTDMDVYGNKLKQKRITPFLILAIFDGLWMISGCFTPEKSIFITMIILNIIYPFIKDNGDEKMILKIFRAHFITKIFLTLIILYWHFHSILWL